MNKYDLHFIASMLGIAREVRLRPIGSNAALEKELRHILGKVPLAWKKLIADVIKPAYQAVKEFLKPSARQAGSEPPNHRLEQAIEAAAREVETLVLRSSSDLRHWTARVEGWTRARMLESVKGGLGKDLGLMLFPEDVKHEISASLQGNIALIRDLDRDARKRLERIVWDGIAKNRSLAEVEAEIGEQLGIVGRRAKLIARDQTQKLTADLVRLRHGQLGIVEYAWSTSKDERVRGNPAGLYPSARPSHWAREGKTFRYDDPPEDGNPGEPVNCRCVALGIINPKAKPSRMSRFFSTFGEAA